MRRILPTLLLIGCVDYDLHKIQEPAEPLVGDTGEETVDTGAPGTALDVLVVLDTSGSMGDDTLIHFGLAQIAEELQDRNADWQLMLITADSTDTLAWEVFPSDPDPEWATMEGITYLLNSGGGYEEGLDAALAFEARSNSWLRPAATTLIVFVSDEDDQSEANPQDLLSEWPYDLQVVSVVGLAQQDRNPTGSETYRCSADEGTRYLQIADRAVDICTTTRWTIF
jgi:hypothetical protein